MSLSDEWVEDHLGKELPCAGYLPGSEYFRYQEECMIKLGFKKVSNPSLGSYHFARDGEKVNIKRVHSYLSQHYNKEILR